MARIGVFAANMTAQTGGAFRLLDELMVTADRSTHAFLYVSHDPRPSAAPLPANVTWLGRSRPSVRAVQVLLNAPGIQVPLARPALARGLLGMTARLRPGRFESVDVWLWPHACTPVPRLGPPVVPIVHDLIHHELPAMFSTRTLRMRHVTERRLSASAAVLCPSQNTRSDLVHAYPELDGRTFVFPAAPSELASAEQCRVELAALERRFGLTPLLLMVGVDWPHKNHELILEVAARLRMHPSDPRFVFVGDRRSDRLRKEINRRGLNEIVVDLGAVDRLMLAALYHRADALLFPSRYEGFGIPLAEAMAYGLPILASDRGGSVSEVVNGAGELLSPDDPDVWVDAIGRLLIDEGYRSRLGSASESGSDRFTWKRTWEALDAVFAELAS